MNDAALAAGSSPVILWDLLCPAPYGTAATLQSATRTHTLGSHMNRASITDTI